MTKDEDQQIWTLLRELEQIAIREHLPSIGPIEGKIILEIMKKHKATTVLEIGTLHGYSAILMANSLSTDGKLITVEIDKNRADAARKNIDKAGLSNKIKVICDNALDVIPTLDGYKFDLVFLDAAKSEYLQYLILIEARNLMKEDSVVIADNVILYENKMKDYLEYVRDSGRYISQTTETSSTFNKNVKDALEISIRSKNKFCYNVIRKVDCFMNTKDKVKLEKLIKIPLDYSYIMLFLTANKMRRLP